MAARKAAAKKGNALVIGGGKSPLLASEAGAALMEKYRGATSVAPVTKIAATGLPWISGRGGSFKCGDAKFGSELEVVVLDWFYERRYYQGEFDEDKPVGATCYAMGRDATAQVAPAPAQAATCAECQWDAFGTDRRGKAKACKEIVRLAVTPATFVKEGASITDLPIYLITVPVVSVKRWNQYMKTLRGFIGDFAPVGAYTRVKATTENNLSLYFEPTGEMVDFEAAQALQQIAIDNEKDIWQPPSRASADDEAKPPKASRKGERRTVA